MENGRSIFEKNKYNAQIKDEQLSNLEKEKSNNKLIDKIENGLNIHSMPNPFRAGKFNSSVHPNDIDKKYGSKNSSDNSYKHKYVGILIVVIGILVLGAFAYFLYNYIMEGSQTNDSQIIQEDNSANNGEIDKTDISDNTNKTTNKDINNNTPTSTEETALVKGSDGETDKTDISDNTDETATSTDIINNDNSTSTEETLLIKDTDGDGLTDAEEHLLNSNINLEDSDSDGYNDASEVLSLFNPAGTNTLLDNPGINEYSNPLYNYTILYPQAWTRKINNGGDSVMFMNDNEGFFQISVEDNKGALNIEDWYRQEFSLEKDKVLNYFNKDKKMISSADGLFIYYTDQEKIYVFSYTAMSQKLLYPNVFKAFALSFSFN